MKYWSYFAAKTALVAFLLLVVRAAIRLSFPVQSWQHGRQDPFAHDLGYTSVMMLFFLFSTGLIYLVIWDQRYRCRTCLRRLRMPVAAGSWPNMFLKGQPRMEYICLYGHGTLKVPDVDLTGSKKPDWESHDDIWKELESIEAGKK
ncbi:MAG: hypothetical protein M3Z32_03105 [Acidobacteriota bacterium]|nr:hypothetical protein [Acidobacteriota bacterium]